MTDKTTKQRALSPRELAVEGIANQHREAMNAEIKEGGGSAQIALTDLNAPIVDEDADHGDADAEKARKELEAAAGNDGGDETQLQLQADQEAAAREQEEEAARVAAETTQRAQNAAGIEPTSKLKLKVNGKEVEITGEEAMRRLQKDVAADDRLAEANRKESEAHRILSEAQQQQRELLRQQEEAAEAAKAKGGNPNGVVVDPTVTKEFTAALFKGDEGEAATAFDKAVTSAVAAALTQQGRGTAAIPVDTSVMRQQIAAQVRQQMTIDSALEQSQKDYPELYADPDMEDLAAARIKRKVAEGVPFVAALNDVASEFSTKFGWKRKPGTSTPQPRSDRREAALARKESLEQTPSGPNVKTGTTEEPQSNVSDTIREIAKARGQSVVS